MKNMLFITLLSLLISCGNENSATNDNHENSEISNSNPIVKSPCELVNEADIKKLFGIPDEVPTDIEDTERTYPTCFYKWETVLFSETKMIGGNEVKIDYPAEMSIVMVKDATDKMFETSTKVYKDGVAENGIGEMATWGGTMSQLTFLSSGIMIHLYVKKSSIESENKEIALKIADIIIGNL